MSKPFSKKKGLVLIATAIVVVGVFVLAFHLISQPKSKEAILRGSFAMAASGKNDSGKELTLEERQKLWGESIDDLVEYTSANPSDADAFKKLAGAYYNKGQYDEAIEAYQKAIALEPKNALNYTNMAHAYLAKGDKDLAKENYQKSIDIDPSITINYLSLSNLSK